MPLFSFDLEGFRLNLLLRTLFKGWVRYIFASLFCMPKIEHVLRSQGTL